jgi:two-component system sensor histidine kinase BarA
MKRLGLSKQIIIVAILPALVVATILSVHYIWDQFDYISESLNNNGKLIAKQLASTAGYAIYSDNIELIKPIINTVIKNYSVLRIQILDKHNNTFLDIQAAEESVKNNNRFVENLLESDKQLTFSEPILSVQTPVEDQKDQAGKNSKKNHNDQTGHVIVTLTTRYATEEKTEQIIHGTFITLLILLLVTLIIVRISNYITRPVKALTLTVKDITSRNFDTPVEENVTGEIGVLQSCINRMADELKHSQSNMEHKLNEYTDELTQTMEELEIRNVELDITRSKAIYANNAKSEFLANMSHEIRTPLSGVIGFTELLQTTQLSNQQKDYTNTIQKSAKNLLEIINDILDLSKIESGKTVISTSDFNVIDIIEDIINLSCPAALEKNVEIFYRIEKDVPDHIKADPFRIHQILTNLIGNAVKFTDDGYVYLQVSTGKVKNAETSIKFTVSDTGIGMNSDDKKNLFQAFTQADTSITRRFGGTGLGLVISRKLTVLMKGEMGLDSTENEGSRFWFSVPVTAIPEKHQPCRFERKKIAFVCDHFIAKQSFRPVLEVCQCQLTDYNISDLDKLSEIEKSNDLLLLFLSRKEINNSAITDRISRLKLSIPSLLIASTNSHSELRNLQQQVFDNAVFSSEKIERIKHKIANTVNKYTDEAEADAEDSDMASSVDWSDIKVMVVDDNEVNLRLAEIILQNHKAQVTTAISGIQAIDYASMNSFDIIFMDLHMPGIDGYETTQKIREITSARQPVIIALTANALPQEKDKVTQSGMNGIIIKPVSDTILKKVIYQWLVKDAVNPLTPLDTVETNIDTENKAVFSIERAKEFTGNNEELAYELFNMLRSELKDHRDAISSAAKSKDLVTLREQVHKLNGASRCCGTTELKEISNRVENLIIQKIHFDIDNEISSLTKAIQNVVDYKVESKNITDTVKFS